MQSFTLLLITRDYELFSFFSRKFESFHSVCHIVPENISVLCEKNADFDYICIDLNSISPDWFSRYKIFISESGSAKIIAFNGMKELDSVQKKILCHEENQGDSETEINQDEKKETLECAPEMTVFERKITLACKSDIPVLLVGESGSGKSYFSRYIHDHSSRKTCKFISQNVAEINSQLFESILFGTTKGAYTDAQEKKGLLETAKGGTISLDEIAELSIENQGKFLGVFDYLVFRKVGSVEDLPVDVRFIFSTDADMKEIVKQQLFRMQLYYRISVLVIEVPPLRKHMKDIKALAEKFAETAGKRVTENAVNKLMNYNWPGNVRQLKNCIMRGSVLSQSDFIDEEHIEFY